MSSITNIGIDSYSFHIAFGLHGTDRIFKLRKEMKLPDFLRTAAELQVHVVQLDPVHIPALSGSKFDQFKDLLASYDFEVALGSYISLVHRGALAAHAIHKYEEYIDACRAVNATILRGVCGADRFQGRKSLEDQTKLVVDNLAQISPYAEDAGVTVAFENHGSLQAQELVSIVEAANSPCVKINLDNGNSLLAFEDAVEAFRIMAPHTVILHFKDYKRTQTGYGMIVEGCPLGEGVIDLQAQIDIFKQVCPDAKLCLEICLKKGKELPAVKQSLELLRALLST
ncbi:MAG TPA: sugar phosphate isomerase/epimerase family protein [Candidatus Lokiarchaeia archaeon]|nr:sugar phosphate isomerase/epimerase family protein [Candidatus Lokiarchaeia archaeon]